jgi:hypothetical protein
MEGSVPSVNTNLLMHVFCLCELRVLVIQTIQALLLHKLMQENQQMIWI